MALFSVTVFLLAFFAIIAIEVTTNKMGSLLRNQQPESWKEHLVNRIRTLQPVIGDAQAAFEPTLVLTQTLVPEIEKDRYAVGNKEPVESTQDALAEMGRTKTKVYILLGLVPVAALALSMYLLYGFIRPIDKLVKGARRIKSGDLRHRITGLSDELAEVASSFNAVVESLGKDNLKMQWAEQLVVLGEMAGGMAHEIKNPLAGIKASIDFLCCDSSLSSEGREILLQASEQIKRIDTLLKSILNFARPPKPQFMPVNINEVLDSTINLALHHPLLTARPSISVIRDFVKVPTTMADPLQLQQVFMNLILNSADAMPSGGVIRFRTDADQSLRCLNITLSDTGPGIKEDILDKVFQPFFTTKSHGTGLGLAISKGLVEQHGGAIRAENNIATGGVSFVICLPLREAIPRYDREGNRTPEISAPRPLNWITT